MRMYDIIHKKRDGGILTDDEIKFWIKGVTDESIPDYQTTALLMAIYYNGLSDSELTELTLAMAESGDKIDLSGINGITIDKHSTGGVGDKTTIIIAPIIAALGGKVAKMSGRGLGHTGGTVDKLSSIPGFRTDIPPVDFIGQVNEIGICLAGHSGNITPADKKIYALRDVTATVESIPLIASSIMSKKIAAGAANIVLDVKLGSGAFMKNINDAHALAVTMVNIGKSVGLNVSAVITNMDIPLGYTVGNALEIKECIEILKGGGNEQLKEICITLAVHMAVLLGYGSRSECRKAVLRVIKDGSALEKLRSVIRCQGGNDEVIDNPQLLPTAKRVVSLTSEKNGYIHFTDSEKVGTAAAVLGAGREKADDDIDYGAGIVLCVKEGDYVNKGDIIGYLHTNDEQKVGAAAEMLKSAVETADKPPEKTVLIYDEIM